MPVFEICMTFRIGAKNRAQAESRAALIGSAAAKHCDDWKIDQICGMDQFTKEQIAWMESLQRGLRQTNDL